MKKTFLVFLTVVFACYAPPAGNNQVTSQNGSQDNASSDQDIESCGSVSSNTPILQIQGLTGFNNQAVGPQGIHQEGFLTQAQLSNELRDFKNWFLQQLKRERELDDLTFYYRMQVKFIVLAGGGSLAALSWYILVNKC